jgi:hypothetical protein
MTLQASGPISFSNIINEFGSPPGINLGAYRVSQTIAQLTLPLDTGIPTSGAISFSSFYSKKLNTVVAIGNAARIAARTRYNNNTDTFCIGGFKTRPASSANTKVWVHVYGTVSSNIGSGSAPNRNYCSMFTGGWEGGTDLRVDIGPSGFISGAGGNGGRGGDSGYFIANAGGGGGFGTSGLCLDYQPVTVTNRGRIQGSGGGGGGGGAAYSENRRSRRRDIRAGAPGGGGGGGYGIPAGAGGGAGGGYYQLRAGINRYAAGGGSGSSTGNGGGGVGAILRDGFAVGGNGGGGQANGGAGSGGLVGAGGAAGASGFGIIVTNNGSGVSITGNGIIGGVAYSTSPS